MRTRLTSALTVLGAATLLVLAANTVAIAATGQGFLLGRSNTASTLTTLTRTTPGGVLNLRAASAAQPPLYTNGQGQVANLNADLLDGFHASSLRSRAYTFEKPVTTATKALSLTVTVPDGSYLIDYSAYLLGAENGGVACYVAGGGDTRYVGESHFDAGPSTPGLTGTGLVRQAAGETIRLVCTTTNLFTTDPKQPIQIVATPVDSVTPATITARHTSHRIPDGHS